LDEIGEPEAKGYVDNVLKDVRKKRM